MSQYLALARKWRPQKFNDYVGQAHVVKALSHALDSGRLHHAFLFTGTRGVGKTTVARLLSKCLNCEQGVSSRPCGHCQSCREIEEGRFVDLIEVDAASRTKVEDTRELLDNVQYAPSVGRYKIYLIDEVHMLSGHSFNALLKTLEEPPPHVKFLLATTDPQKLPVTVLSRCLQFNLRRLDLSQIRERMAHILDAEGISYDMAALSMLGRAADGSMRDGLSLLDQAIVHGGGELREIAVADMLGLADRGLVFDVLDALARLDATGLFGHLRQALDLGRQADAFLDDLLHMLHQIALRQALGIFDEEDPLEAERLDLLAQAFSPPDLQLYYQIALIGRRDLALAPDPRLGLEMAVLRMLAFQPEGRSEEVPTTQAGLEPFSPGLSPFVSEEPAPYSSSRDHPTDVPPAGTAEIPPPQVPLPAVEAASPMLAWGKVIPALKVSQFWKAVLDHSIASDLSQDNITISLAASHSYGLENPKFKPELEQALSQYLGRAVRVRLTRMRESGDLTPARQQEQEKQSRQHGAEQAIHADPMVRGILESFNGEIVKIVPKE